MTPTKDAGYILAALREPAIILSADYEILAANDAYRQAYGFSDRSGRRRCYEVSHHYQVPCDLAGETCPLKDSRESGETARVLHIHHTPRGEEYVNVEMWPIKNDDGEIEFYIERMFPSQVASTQSTPGQLVGRSKPFQAMLQLIEKAAPSNTSVLLLGESGTGKELVAQTLHRLSKRSDQPFVPVECSGLPDNLLESELFGYEKGAFTGADQRRSGLIEAASGGTLFLDEVGDIPLAMQVKLLRLLESRRYRRLGSNDWQEADFRLIAATNRNLSERVASGEFREDLYYRLAVFEIELPTLHDRMDDLPLLIETLLASLNASELRFSDASMACLKAYDFPGNVRELRNIVERATLLADEGVVEPAHLPKTCREAGDTNSTGNKNNNARAGSILSLAEAEQRYLVGVLNSFEGDRRELAEQLGISERALYRKLALMKKTT